MSNVTRHQHRSGVNNNYYCGKNSNNDNHIGIVINKKLLIKIIKFKNSINLAKVH